MEGRRKDENPNSPELCVMTPFSRSNEGSCFSRSMAWKAPRALKAPIFWKFSHLNQKRMTGLAGVRPAHSDPASSASVRGVDASRFSVALVSTGVLWMYGSISLCAACTDARVSGGAVDGSAMAFFFSFFFSFFGMLGSGCASVPGLGGPQGDRDNRGGVCSGDEGI
jgi:hypothetical protein